MMTYYEATEKHIDEIMDTFNFAKVHKVMKFLNWGWGGGLPYNPLDLHVPDESELRSRARKLLREVSTMKDTTIATGGFEARNTVGIDGDGKWVKLNLAFNLETWDLDGETYE